jgi:limonene-1,2-epoxide hydrolase
MDYRRSYMESPSEVVRRFCAAWSNNLGADDLAAFFTDDAVYYNIPLAPVIGREAIANTIASFIRPGAPGIEAIEFRVINIASNGPVVMTVDAVVSVQSRSRVANCSTHGTDIPDLRV